MDIDIEETRKLLRIDKHRLDEAIAEQADVYYQVAEAHAHARDAADTEKNMLDAADSNESLRLRKEAEKKSEKTTEGKLAEQVLTSERHKTDMSSYQAKRLEEIKLSSLREAFQQRASMLKLMAELYASGYFALSATYGGKVTHANAAAAEGRDKMAVRRTIVKGSK